MPGSPRSMSGISYAVAVDAACSPFDKGLSLSTGVMI